uniref:Uncharacterized protein n=1 Tax=Oryza brachyantha TaxID=4533 RepID=J3L4F2_ORYBR
MKRKGNKGGCLCAPFRALSRACGSACDLYVRGMSGGTTPPVLLAMVASSQPTRRVSLELEASKDRVTRAPPRSQTRPPSTGRPPVAAASVR